MHWKVATLMAALTMAVGCAEPPPPEPAEMADEGPVPPAPNDPMMQAPSGGYVQWVADLREGLGNLMAQAQEDRTVAQHAVQRLYETRQQYLVQYFGENGSARASDDMAEAVRQVSIYMQELMRQLSTDEVALEQVQESVTAAQAALTSVESEGQAAGLAPTAPRTP